MPPTVALLGCLDTKGEELLWMRRVLESEGVSVRVIDAAVLGEPPFEPDIPAAEVARAAGADLAALRSLGDRGEAVGVMARGATEVVRRLHAGGAIHGVLGAGGSAGTTIATSAMRALPVGVPKVMVSTLASGNVAPYVGTKDVTLVHSVVDIAGLNRISSRILAGAARACAAMARGSEERPPGDERPLVAATMFGVTTPCVTAAREVLEAAGYEVLVFHATGSGGRSLEALVDEGWIRGVLDITTTELADELVGGVMSAGPGRLTAAGRAGVPQVVVPGAVDMVNFGPRESVPDRFRDRRFHEHNPTVTLMRTTVEECAEIGRRMAERLTGAAAPVRVLLPSGGVSLLDREGQPFHDPGADARLFAAIRDGAGPPVEVEASDAEINDPAFARRCAETLLELMGRKETPARSG